MTLVYVGLTENVAAQSDNPATIRQFRPRVDRGITIYRIGALWYTGRNLSDTDLVGADRLYYGGYHYDVPEAELIAMEAQGIHASINV